MTLQVDVKVPDLAAIAAKISPQGFEQGLRVGLSKAGNRVALEARQIIHPHHFTGHYEQEIHTEITGSGFNLTAIVGVSKAQVPEAAPLSYGWRSTSGRQPPTDAIARWIARKPSVGSGVSSNILTNSSGFRRTNGTISSVSSESAVRGLAFVIARKIGRKGYSFAPLNVWENAWNRVRSEVGGIIHTSIGWRQ